jgi:DNA-binding response OmpR family regulator
MPPVSGIRRSGQTCSVLVVEDDFDSADLLCVLFEQAGHDCQIALNAAEARAIIEDFTPDIALIDIGLPGESGYQLLQHLKAQLADCRFVAMTGYGSAEMLTKSLEAGFEAHLTKPVSIDLLMAVLDQCAGRTEAGAWRAG